MRKRLRDAPIKGPVSIVVTDIEGFSGPGGSGTQATEVCLHIELICFL